MINKVKNITEWILYVLSGLFIFTIAFFDKESYTDSQVYAMGTLLTIVLFIIVIQFLIKLFEIAVKNN